VLSVSLDVSAVPGRPAGAGRYTLDLARELGGRDDVALTLVARTADARRWGGVAPRATVLAVAPGPRPGRLVWEQVALPGVLARGGAPDVHHGPHYTMPERARLPRVVTVHDLTFFDHPEWHERTKVWFFRRAIRVAARRADAVVCVSAATTQRLQELLSPRAEVVTVPHGVDHSRFRPARPGEEEADAAVLAAHGVTGRYVAFLGTVEPRKGLDVLLRAFDAVADAHPGVGLVAAGGRGWGAGPVDDELGRMRHRDRVVRTGYLAEEALPGFLRRAEVVAYPSRAEGFGLPVLEALACGARVVTTSGSVMDEVAGGAAALVPPGDAAALAAALDAELTDAVAGRAPRREAGLAVAAGHTWARCADAHVAVYRRVAGAT
jgi:glycosyltransferase involved in cell wall biosynthesis